MWYSLRQINRRGNVRENVPRASLLTAAFFVVSWIHIPVPPTSVHLVLNGLLGAVLGYFAFPAIVIGLFFQAVLFQHGGLTTLGVNAIIMGVPALLAYHIFRLRGLVGKGSRAATGGFGFLAGVVAIALGVGLFVVILVTNIPAGFDAETERAAIATLALGHVPLMFIEGTFVALVTVFLQRVRPRLLDGI
jgi:cobalt/nickel transport system permease protein